MPLSKGHMPAHRGHARRASEVGVAARELVFTAQIGGVGAAGLETNIRDFQLRGAGTGQHKTLLHLAKIEAVLVKARQVDTQRLPLVGGF